MAESKLHGLSTEFAVKIISLCDGINGHSYLVDQLEKAATSIGANIHGANYAQGKADFIANLQAALKGCYETEYWLELFVKAQIIEQEVSTELCNLCETIRRTLTSSVNTASGNVR